MCAQKLTDATSIYRTEPETKNRKELKTKNLVVNLIIVLFVLYHNMVSSGKRCLPLVLMLVSVAIISMFLCHIGRINKQFVKELLSILLLCLCLMWLTLFFYGVELIMYTE